MKAIFLRIVRSREGIKLMFLSLLAGNLKLMSSGSVMNLVSSKIEYCRAHQVARVAGSLLLEKIDTIQHSFPPESIE